MDPVKYGLHSARIGGATCALVSSGGNKLIVKQMGFLKGESVRKYARPTAASIDCSDTTSCKPCFEDPSFGN